jgi:hypothetical protein
VTKGAARHRRGATPFSPGWYYQPGLKVLFSFPFSFQFIIDFGF